MKKITRKELRRMLLEQAQSPQGPFLVVEVSKQYPDEIDVYITKALPDESWWHSEEGGGLGEDIIVHIIDMSAKEVRPPGMGIYSGGIFFNKGFIAEIHHPESQ